MTPLRKSQHHESVRRTSINSNFQSTKILRQKWPINELNSFRPEKTTCIDYWLLFFFSRTLICKCIPSAIISDWKNGSIQRLWKITWFRGEFIWRNDTIPLSIVSQGSVLTSNCSASLIPHGDCYFCWLCSLCCGWEGWGQEGLLWFIRGRCWRLTVQSIFCLKACPLFFIDIYGDNLGFMLFG